MDNREEICFLLIFPRFTYLIKSLFLVLLQRLFTTGSSLIRSSVVFSCQLEGHRRGDPICKGRSQDKAWNLTNNSGNPSTPQADMVSTHDQEGTILSSVWDNDFESSSAAMDKKQQTDDTAGDENNGKDQMRNEEKDDSVLEKGNVKVNVPDQSDVSNHCKGDNKCGKGKEGHSVNTVMNSPKMVKLMDKM